MNEKDVVINLDDIEIDEQFLSERVAELDKDLSFLKEKENSSELSKKQIEAIEKNYTNQLASNPFKAITPIQMQAIDMLLNGKPKYKICQELEISRPALNSWLKNETFLSVLDSTKKDIDESNRAYFNSLVPKALERLADILTDPEANNKDVLGAIRLTLTGADLLKENGSNSITHNQTQIIISPVKQDNVREIENEIIDVTPKE